MIFHLRHGQLGNQIFEYCNLKKNFPKEKIILIGMSELKTLYDIKEQNYFKGNSIYIKILRILSKKIEYFILKSKLFSIIKENKLSKPVVIKGLFNNLKFSLSDNYFQNNECFAEFEKIKINQKHIKNLKKKKILEKNITNIFVHIRRNEYLSYPSKKYPAALDAKWYKSKIRILKKKFKNSKFFIISDDKEYIKKNFKKKKFHIINSNWINDYTLMSFCDHAIISASSFSLFASLSNYHKSKRIIAPKYWLGYQQKKWLPNNIKFHQLRYYD